MGLFARTKSFFNKKRTFTPDEFIFKFLRNGSSAEMNINGSTVPQVFEYVIPAGKFAWLQRINISGHNEAITPELFIGLSALGVGLKFEALDELDNVLIEFTDGLNIKKNVDFNSLAGVDSTIDVNGAGQQDGFSVRWTMAKAGEALFMRAGYKLRVTIADDLRSINQLRMMVQGVFINEAVKSRS